MELGFALPVAGSWATPENQVRVAQRAEELGYSSVWTFQRLLYAVEPRNDYPSAPGQPWPPYFRSVADPIVTLAYVAAATSRVRLGTATINVPFYAPVVLAKQLATLDIVSNGRLDVGLGLGWSQEEYEASGTPFRDRGARADEFLRCLTEIWSDGPVEFEGRFYRVPKALVEPKPVQKPRPPLLFGGYAPATARRVATLADGYIGGNVPLAQVAPLVHRLREAAERADRDPDTLRLVSRGSVKLFDTPQGPDRRPLWGSLDEIREDVERYREAGMKELFIELNFDPEIASPDSDKEASMERAMLLMEGLAPGAT